MASYKVVFKPSVRRDLEGLPQADHRRIVEKILALANEPRPPGAIKLSGEDSYRIRQGDYRIVYLVDDGEHVVRIMRVAHRKDVYR